MILMLLSLLLGSLGLFFDPLGLPLGLFTTGTESLEDCYDIFTYYTYNPINFKYNSSASMVKTEWVPKYEVSSLWMISHGSFSPTFKLMMLWDMGYVLEVLPGQPLIENLWTVNCRLVTY